MNKPTISLCMIVRDEAETLRSAIECVKPLCDEIVIGIDDRSSDESESIASEYADILYKFKWNGKSLRDHFAEITEIKGRGKPCVNVKGISIPGRHGQTAFRQTYKPRIIEIEGTVEGTSHADLMNNIDDLKSLFAMEDDLMPTGNKTISDGMAYGRLEFGSKSQKIEEADVGEGITQTVILVTNNIYSLYVWVYVVSSNVKLEINDGVDDQPSASGETAETSITGVWTQLIVEGIIAQSTAGTVKILSNDAQSEFYVDSVMVEKAARLSIPNEFYPISGARLLWDEGFDALQENKAPKTKYVVNAVDLYEMDPDAFQYDKIEVGDTILVQDDELGIDISARVQSKKLDLLEPWKTEYEIDNFADRLPKTLLNEARRNNRVIRNIGNLMGRRVDDRKLSSSGLAVNKRELRILG